MPEQMHGWHSVDTARCVTCAVYTPTADLRSGPDGKPYCVLCGIPPSIDDWVVLPRPALTRTARIVACVMLLVPVVSMLAACASQL